MNNIPVIACSTDDNFIVPLMVMLKSVEQNTQCKQIIVYVLCNNISEKNLKKIYKSIENTCINISIININNSLLGKVKTDVIIPIASYYRLLLSDLLPLDVTKVIYLDCDLIVRTDIFKLWEKNVNDVGLLAAQETNKLSCCVSSRDGLRTYEDLGIPSDQKYFNAGVLLINLEYWRKENITNKILRYLDQYYERVLWHDQDGLNAVLWDQWKPLEPQWNVMSNIFVCDNFKDSILDEKEFNKVIKQPYIIHFSDVPKPWEKGCNHKKKDEFYKYMRKLIC